MKKIISIFSLVLCFTSVLLSQSVAEMEAKLNKATTPKPERLNLSYALAEKLLGSNPLKAADYAHRASLLASELKDKRREVGAVYLAGEAHDKKRNNAETIARFSRAYSLAKSYGYNDYALNSLKKLQEVNNRAGNYREAYRWSQEHINFVGGNPTAVTTTSNHTPYSSKTDNRAAQLEAENKRLRDELSRITGKSQLLESNYRETEDLLKEVKSQTETQLSKKDETIEKVTEKNMRMDSLVRKKEKLVNDLTKDQMADSIMLKNRESQIKEQKIKIKDAEIAQKNSENTRNVLAILSAFILSVAALLYLRYRAKKRTAADLSEKNNLLETERKRSDNLLLNILPPAIATELRNKNKVSPQKYENATVMFIDFKGFTNVSERLTPEMLVEELDYCFSNFDRIISQFRIEKIKTIGDAYMCASGLSDMNASPSDMVKAALEIQDFLLHLKAERMARNLPCFEARIGIHTGPVVAGVVGTKKFAYDIWGDTVNIASRIEEACEPGKVNVSESAYWLAKYEFDWQHRGKVAAKNKGMIDMYYVTAIRPEYVTN